MNDKEEISYNKRLVNNHLKVNMILAHDVNCGIGYNGDLPWSPCEDDMRLFRRLTTGNESGNNCLNSFCHMNSYSYNGSNKSKHNNGLTQNIVSDIHVNKKQNIRKRINAVIMGYNTWKSLPEKHRPLKNRVNIVLSNNHCEELCNDPQFINGYKYTESHLNTSNITENKQPCYVFSNWFDIKQHLEIDIFSGLGKYKEAWIIGGAEIYRGAIENLNISLVYRTKFKKSYICDKYFDIENMLLSYGYEFDRILMTDNNDYSVECLEVKQRIVC